MFRKINIKILVVVFAILLALVVFIQLADSKKGNRTFKNVLVEVLADEVSSIELFPKVKGGEVIKLLRENDA